MPFKPTIPSLPFRGGGLFRNGPAGLAGQGVQLKVMSFNVWSENSSLLPAAKLIRKKDLDILLLQEVVSRYPITPLMVSRKLGLTQAVRVDTAAGAITVFNVHPQRGNWKRRHWQMTTLLQEHLLPTPGPVLLGGDFNTTDRSQTYRMLSRQLRNAHWEAGRGFGFTYPANLHAWGEFLPAWPLVRIDHIFYNRYFQAVSAETLRESCGSDHLPVMANLMLLKNPER
jgi:endonuclease/exonuclease/phosphatase (EEP) superfamily protein YafD